MVMKINKNFIYKIVFETINESLEWGYSAKDSEYGNYIGGVCSLANEMIAEIDKAESDNCKSYTS